MILGMKTAALVAIAYIALTYGGGYIDKQTENLEAVGVSRPAIELVQGAFEETGAAIGTAAAFFGVLLPAYQARRQQLQAAAEEEPALWTPASGPPPAERPIRLDSSP